jgi:hypothetical protein
MHEAVLERKKQILFIIDRVRKCSVKNEFRHEMMTYAYVLTNGAIEYMVETILREWVVVNVKKHANSNRYRGKIGVNEYLRISSEISTSTIDRFHNPDYGKIVELIKNVAGERVSKRFKELVDASKATEPELNAKLNKINDFRHRLAHGKTLPRDTQPNLDELRSDFKNVYAHIIKNLDIALRTKD